jgi:hypothetical protein
LLYIKMGLALEGLRTHNFADNKTGIGTIRNVIRIFYSFKLSAQMIW